MTAHVKNAFSKFGAGGPEKLLTNFAWPNRSVYELPKAVKEHATCMPLKYKFTRGTGHV